MSITEAFQQRCQVFQQSTKVKRWVVALSGGLDSMVTLELAHQILPANSVVAIHINHQQQLAADDWQSFCQQQCLLRNIPFFPFKVSPQGTSEQILRSARYQCFESFLESDDCLLFGHHANDQAETVLFRLIRGAGAKGISGMPVERKIAKGWLLRPLLTLAKSTLSEFAQVANLTWINDPSNDCTEYDRNYIRHKVLAPITKHWHKASEQMAVSAKLINQDQQLLDRYLAADVAKISSGDCLDLELWDKYDELQGVALLRFWLTSLIGRVVTRKELSRVINDVIGSKIDSHAYSQFGQRKLRRYQQKLYLVNDYVFNQQWPSLSSELLNYKLTHGELNLTFSCQGIKLLDGMFLQSRSQACDGLLVKATNRASKKLKKVFHEQGIAPWLRANWPLLMYKNELVAIPGICVCDGWLQETENNSNLCLDWQPL